MQRVVRVGLLVLSLCALSALSAGVAAAEPGSGPRETVDQSFTTTSPNAPTGFGYTGTYHAAGDESAPPPYMRQMTFYYPPGLRFDTGVPDRCTATDVELEARGPAACPPGSHLGDGTTEGLFMEPIANSFVFDHYTHHLDVMNNANEQIILIESEGWTVVRGHIQPDNSIEFDTTTCFPAPPAGQCPNDYIIQLGSTTSVPAYTKTVDGSLRSYVTTPPTCPRQRYWETTVRFTWADGNIDNVVSRQPCSKR